MTIDNLTIGELKEITQLINGETIQLPFKVGEKYLFRTVTHYDVGEITAINGAFVTLKDASWIPDTGRYHDCLATGEFDEIEPYPNGVFVNTAATVDAAPWPHPLPREKK